MGSAEIVIEIIENPGDILKAIEMNYNIEHISDGKMWLSKPTRKQVEVEKDGYFERGDRDEKGERLWQEPIA